MTFTTAQTALLDANRDAVEARRMFEVQFASGTVRLIEGSTPYNDGTNNWLPAHAIISVGELAFPEDGPMVAAPVEYRFGYITPDLSTAMQDEAEWRDRLVIQRMQLFADGMPVGPAVVLHRGRIADIRQDESVSTEQFVVRVEGPFRDRNETLLGKYTDRDQQMRSPGDRGCEYAAQYETSGGAEFTGWLQL
ncbi:hypothetical protein [Paracoccus sp. (in: a-proteobacteria)]|uniref:hypothetical protein n=1 Tax=Paracoccus sp. TaxID=267 RepID=UPI00272AEE4F|nr:hypothetical protein [Paracoccus sp. (in: a-proteobacteria)]